MERIIKGRLIYLIDESRGLLFKNLSFFVVDLRNGETELVGRIPAGAKEGILCHCRLTERLLRLEPKCVGRLDGDRFVICVLRKLWLLDLQERMITSLGNMRTGYGILNFCECDGHVYWGDYGANPNRDEINIYKLDENLNISTAYSFPRNGVRHIHNIIKTAKGFVVMTGDNEKVAGIYQVNSDWTEIKPWKNGEQKYRAVVGFHYQGGLLYATDSVETENHLRYIDEAGAERILATMNGSCIYGGETRDYFLFSTTVESPEGGGKLGLFSRKLGGGIKSDEVHVVAVSKKDLSVKTIIRFKKDSWPMKLMQYGQAVFAGGQGQAVEGFWCYPMSCKKYDGKSVFIKFDE